MLQILHALTASRLMAVPRRPTRTGCLKARGTARHCCASSCSRQPSQAVIIQLAWMQLLGWTAVTREQLELPPPPAERERCVVPGLAVDTELRWALLRLLAAMGRAGDAEIDAELAMEATHAGRRLAAASRAAIPDAAHKAEAWQLIARSQELGHEGDGGGQRLRPTRARRAAGSVRGCVLRGAAGDGRRAAITSSGCWGTGCSLWAASPELLSRVDEFLAAEQREPSMVRVLIERRDIIDRALRSRALPD